MLLDDETRQIRVGRGRGSPAGSGVASKSRFFLYSGELLRPRAQRYPGRIRPASDGRFAPSPHRRPPPRQPPHGAARVALRALRAAGASCAHGGPRSRPRARASSTSASSPTSRALGIDWDGPVVRQSRAARAVRGRARAARQPTRAGARARRSREAASAPHGDLPEGAYPGTCRELSARRARRARARPGRPPALRLRADGERVDIDDRAARPPVAGVVDDFVLRRGDGAFAYNLAVVVDDGDQGVGRGRARRRPGSTRRRARCSWRACSACPSRATPTCRSMLGPDGARLAKRHGAVTLAERRALRRDAGTGARRPRGDARPARHRARPPSSCPASTPERLRPDRRTTVARVACRAMAERKISRRRRRRSSGRRRRVRPPARALRGRGGQRRKPAAWTS